MKHLLPTRLFVSFAAALVLCACPGSGGGGGGAPTFSKSYGADALDLATDVAPTPDGGYVMVGSFNGRRLGGELVDEDLWVTRLDAYGDLVWSKVYSEDQTSVGDADEAYLYRIALPRAGDGFFLVGQLDRLYALDEYDLSPKEVAVTRLDEDGNTLWTQSYGFSDLPRYPPYEPGRSPSAGPFSAVPTSDGGLLVAGFAESDVRVGKTKALLTAPWVMKVDASGNRLWWHYVEDELYTVAIYRNSGIHVRETLDGGAVIAIPSSLNVDNPSLFALEDSTQVKRFDALGNALWTCRHDDLSTQDIAVFQRSGGGEGYLLSAEDFDDLSANERVLLVLDGSGNELERLDDVDAFDRIYASVELTGGTGENLFGSVGRSDEAGDPDYLRVEVFDQDLAPMAQVDLQGTQSLLALRSFDEGTFAGFELLASDLQDPAEETGDLLNIRITPDGSIIRYTRYPRGVPAFVHWHFLRGLRIGGWIDGSTDYWLWTPVDQDDPTRGMTLARYGLTSGQQWSKTFGPEIDRRVERALQVEVIPDPEDPTAFEIAVLGEVAWSFLQNPPPADEPLSAWVLRLDADGEPRSQRVLEELTLSYDGELYRSDLFQAEAPELRRSSRCLQAAPDGGLFVAGREDGYDRVVLLDEGSSVVWCTRPLADAQRGPLRSICATADGGVVAIGSDWLAKVDAGGQVVWRRSLAYEGASTACELEGGELLVAYAFRGLPGLLGFDADGTLLWDRLADDGGAALHDGIVGIVATPDGAAVLVYGELNPLTGASANTNGVGEDTWDLRLVKADADGTFLWSQTYGGLVEEALGDVSVAPDGGLILAGRSDSLGVQSEAWLLRTDSCGEITQGCRAALRRTDPLPPPVSIGLFAAAVYQPSIPAAADVPGTLQGFPTAARQTSVTSQVVVARQCSGSSKDRLPVEEVLLTVTVAEGSGVLREDVGPGESPLVACITSCQVSVPKGTRVRLRATPDAGYLPALWSGGDCGAGPSATCSVLMDTDRTVSVVFPVDEGGYMGELYALSVDFLGSGAGSVAIQPLNATCTQDCTFVDLALPGDTFILTATPAAGSSFVGWSGVDDADGNVARVTFGAADRTVGARFE